MHIIDIFKAGKRRDSQGQLVDITTADLQALVEAYDPHFHEAPVVIGHPKDNHPAYAWVKGLRLEGNTLQAELDQIDPAFAEMVQAGRFKKISASFYLPQSPSNPKQGTFYLRHVGFLGAMPPAVKGLRNPTFAEGEEGVVDFGEPSPPSSPTSHNPPQEDIMTPEEIAALKAENEQLKAEKAAAEHAKAQAKAEADQAANAAFTEQLLAEGKLAPKAKASALALLDYCATASRGEAVEFNEGESLHSLLKAFLANQPKVIEFNEIATQANAASEPAVNVQYAETDDPARIELDRRVRAYMQQHSVDYATALAAVA